ncbi:MAG: hypothetical protein U1F48_04615 [Burkholderiales bacterium]
MNSSFPTSHLRAAHDKAPVCVRAGWRSHSRRNAGIAAGNGGVAVLK